MKIREIILEYDFPEVQHKKQWNIPDMHNKECPDKEKLGSGCYSTAYADDSQDVTKGSRKMLKLDGYTSFLEALSKDEDTQSNPCFPHFSSIEVYKNKNMLWPTKSYVVKMERLFPFTSLRKSEKQTILNHLILKDTAEATGHNEPFWIIATCIQYPKYASLIKDKNLAKAAQFIQQTAEEYKYHVDINEDNIMIRRGRFIPQVVIIDPLASARG